MTSPKPQLEASLEIGTVVKLVMLPAVGLKLPRKLARVPPRDRVPCYIQKLGCVPENSAGGRSCRD